ncbi:MULTISPECIES: hypothetical protein [unclassified Nodularia (in: cyanobacteria)]|uniref:hypothetical protein n=1 Tax=unclassified Nodularia (in: cyanobacteria) TaxID=2656917 RepID=UPI00187E3292|nr:MULTISPECIES: hypothetical protein [unclassified Nodularia (in: cyanobacteria)]MBE9201658.1 hypothetical protein [Nodularia sp. LEGE 06071]MCC2691874.1 hypothetical protein [Nodularia sp. LEGE 04288]
MAEQVKPNVNQASTHDAQLAAENMASGEEKAAKVDFESDYAAAQEFSVSEIDRTNEGVAAASAATAPKQKISEVAETKTETESSGNPKDYVEMAKELGGSRTEGVTNVNDDLVQKAFKKGESKQ